MEKKVLVTRASMPPYEEYIEEIRDIWDTHWLTNMGSKHKQLQAKLESYMNVPHLELMVNGHMALEMALQSFDLKGEVITTPFTFASTTHAIVRNGLKPIFCDIKEEDCTIDPEKIEDLITDKTCAIVPVHVYGNVCDTERIDCIAKKHNLKVIYDAAHTFGERYKGKGVGNYGDASIFSFHATKVYNSIEGGCVCYRDESIGRILYNLKNFGIWGSESVEGIGANAKMNEFQAAMGLCNLRHIDEYISGRRCVVNKYREKLSNIRGIRVWNEQLDTEHNYAYFPIFVNADEYGMSRNELFDKLKANGIGSRKYFYPLTNEFECYRDSYDVHDTPIAKSIAESVITLPLYPELMDSIIDEICEIIRTTRC